MNINANLYIDSYTIRNALCWGICRDHFRKIEVENLWYNRVIHITIGCLEALPVAGQIVSLIELGIIKFFVPSLDQASKPLPQRPQPVSCRPSSERIESNSSFVPMIWPKDLTKLGLTEDQKNDLEKHLSGAFLSGNFKLNKRTLIYTDIGCSNQVTVDLPLTTSIVKIDNFYHNILLPKTVFIQTGERKIRWAYDLTTGEYLLKKRIVGALEEKLLDFMTKNRKTEGIKKSLIFREVNLTPETKKRQILEPLKDGTVSKLFGTEPFASFGTRCNIALDLLNDLKLLHAGNIVVRSVHFPQGFDPIPVNVFHSDIKFENILVSFDNKWSAEFCDFGGGATSPSSYSYSIGFTPPEYIRHFEKIKPLGLDIDSQVDNSVKHFKFNADYGQGRDIWALGLVILSVLTDRKDRIEWMDRRNEKSIVTIAPLKCLRESVGFDGRSYYDEAKIVNLKQEALDKEINELEQELIYNHKNDQASILKYFKVVRGMLKINPNERKNIIELLEIVNK